MRIAADYVRCGGGGAARDGGGEDAFLERITMEIPWGESLRIAASDSVARPPLAHDACAAEVLDRALGTSYCQAMRHVDHKQKQLHGGRQRPRQ